MIRLLAAAAINIAVAGFAIAAPSPATAGPADCALKPPPGVTLMTPNNALEAQYLDLLCKPSAEKDKAFAQAFAKSKLYVEIAPGPPADDGGVGIWMVQLPDGSHAMAVYMSKEALAAAFHDGKMHRYAAYMAKDVLRMADGKAIALNWGVDPHFVIRPQAVIDLIPYAEAAEVAP